MKWKVSLTQLMALILVLAVGLATMKAATEWAVRCVLLGSVLVLLIAMVGAIVRKRRAPWVGFSVFAWGYVLVLVVTEYVQLTSTATGLSIPLRIDGPMMDFTNWLHVLPYPQEPFVYQRVWNTSTIPYTSELKGLDFQNQYTIVLTPQQAKLAEEHSARLESWRQSVTNGTAACWIGLAFQGLAFASLGAVAGHLLDRGNS
jgi:hypothetical protein